MSKDFRDTDARRDRLLGELVESRNESEGVLREVKTPATADTEFAVTHALGRKPTCARVEGQRAAGTLYRSSEDRWGERVAFFKYSGGADTLLVRFC